MKSTTAYEWGIIVFGENNKGRITHEMMRSFADVFRKKSSKLGLNLVQSPSFLFTKNVTMVQSEVEEWFEEVEPNKDVVLVLLFNDSDSNEVEEKMQRVWGENVILYIKKSDNLLRCARDESEKIITRWIEEICKLLKGRFREGKFQGEHIFNRDSPLFNFVDVANIFADLQKSEKAVKDLDLIKYIDNPMLHNRLRIPFTKREQNGQLLAILSAASCTELPDLQATVINFVEKIIKSGFISFVLRENAYYIDNIANGESCRTLFTYLLDIMQILYISRINQIQDFNTVCDEFLNFMELIPEKCWSSIDEEFQLTVFRMLQKLTVFSCSVLNFYICTCVLLVIIICQKIFQIDTSKSLTVSLHEDYELNVTNSNGKCFGFDNHGKLDFVKKCRFDDYKSWINNDDAEPSEDFRTLSVYATSNDILHPVRPYIRRNIVRGCYSSQEHYLDVQFRLMREDLVGPLRDGIKLWREQDRKDAFLSYAMDPSEELDLLIIRGVTVEGAQLKRSTGEMIRYIVFQTISTDSFWSSRLKYGQLVTLSSDGFKDEALLATIAEKGSDDFSKGKLGLCFFDDRSVSRAKIYTLIESVSYYEMYQHVLECIKRFDNDHEIPFGRFLLKAETDVQLPSYLQQIDGDSHSSLDSHSSSDSINSEYTDYMDKLKYTLDGDKVACGLDNAQRNALYHALTHEFALIQGPPGTGKTFIGRLLVRILLENMNIWNPERINPMLVVCFTNHALDQFLDGVLVDLKEDGLYNDEFPSIVRFGSRCKSETLLKYTKRPVLEAYANLISDTAKNKANRVMRKRTHLLKTIRSQVAVLTRCKSEILSIKYMQDAMLPEHIKQFNQQGRKGCSVSISSNLYCGFIPYIDEIFCRWLLEGDAGREDCVNVKGNANEKTFSNCQEKKFSENEDPGVSTLWSMDEIFVEKESNERKEEMLERFSEMNEWTTWEEIQERLHRTNPDIDNYYHFGEWDLDKDPNAPSIKEVTILSDQKYSKKRRRINIKYYAELTARLEDVKADILKTSALTLDEASSIRNLQTLHMHRRWALYMHWISKLKCVVNEKLDILISKYQTLMEEVNKEYDLLDEIILRKALIIGATTTCAAKIKPFLDRLGCPIVIVEEAAEVLEAHVLTSITSKCQHVILIGDHKQLRPSPAVFALAREYNLDISLFERLIKNHFPYARLEEQHRMATVISNTLMPEFYPLMKDAKNVLSYPSIEGCRKNLFFINHCHEEDVIFSTSCKNSFEGDFMVNLSAYFVQQGYACSQITLLCAYTAQANYVRTQVMLKFSNANFPLVETVDNYQGEENDIIILSLVRSQPSSSVGFLGVSNRVCVALSRSKLGLYVIGNMHFLRTASTSSLWDRLYTALVDADCFGNGFPAYCIKHDVTQIIYNANEFLEKTPQGGCCHPCDFVRPCGHICDQLCHRYDRFQGKEQENGNRTLERGVAESGIDSDKISPNGKNNQFRTDPEHKRICSHSCPKTCATIFRHPCTRLCGESCGPCQSFENKTFYCGHTARVVCHLFEKAVCQQKCQKKLPCGYNCVKQCNQPCKCLHEIFLNCGHIATASCSEKQKIKCIVEVEKTFTTCNHRWRVSCYNYEDAQCGEKCERILPCGHRCQLLCGNCTLKGCGSCASFCNERLPCGHNCLRPCGTPCGSCKAPCSNQCGHSHCGQQLDVHTERGFECGDFCSLCVQRCLNSCKHQKCQMQCWQVCSINPCSFSCDKKLECGHLCLSPCGEICPDVCAECQGMNVPVLQFQGCKCIVSVEEADLHIQGQTSRKQQYTCPKCACKLSANSCFRYARELKEQVIYNERTKFAKLLIDGLLISSQCNVLKQAEDDLAKIMEVTKMKKGAAAMEVAEILSLVITRLKTESYNQLGVMKWQVMVNMISDMCRLTVYVITKKFTSIPKKRYSNLYKLFQDSVGTTNNIFPVLELDLLNLSVFAKLLKTESPSMLEIPVANGLRKVSIKYMLGCLANDCIRKLKDLDVCQINALLEITMKALDWSSNVEQKKASMRFMQYYRDLYEVLGMKHMLIGDLQCMNFPN
uniref:AAA_11 domain-containing protein n=1 Tax=Elaeophora elaphi TaxID=1147741 RepID=A0A158Q7X7_9BILA